MLAVVASLASVFATKREGQFSGVHKNCRAHHPLPCAHRMHTQSRFNGSVALSMQIAHLIFQSSQETPFTPLTAIQEAQLCNLSSAHAH